MTEKQVLESYYAKKAAALREENPDLVQFHRDEANHVNRDIEAIEAKLGIDGHKPGEIKARSVYGTTAHHAFSSPTIRELSY